MTVCKSHKVLYHDKRSTVSKYTLKSTTFYSNDTKQHDML